jgi:LuxR family maltose regulon positive regulatory protein
VIHGKVTQNRIYCNCWVTVSYKPEKGEYDLKVIVKGGKLFKDQNDGRKTIDLGSAGWFRWLAKNKRFIYRGEEIQFSARREKRRGSYYWYGYCRRKGKLNKVYLGKDSALTQSRLSAAEKKLKNFIDSEPTFEMSSSQGLFRSTELNIVSVPERKGVKEARESFTLRNRLTPPSLPANLIARENLLEQINTPITLISAPVGYGKTTLLNQWQVQYQYPVAWVALKEEEGKSHTFWSTIAFAMQKIDQSLGLPVLNSLRPSLPIPLEQIISRLIRNVDSWLSAKTNRRFALILDNYDKVHNPEIDTLCQFFLDQLPVGMQVIIASQESFSFDVQQWRIRREITELSINDLSLTPKEGVAYLQRAESIHLTSREKMMLSLKADGWIAGLQILVSALRTQDDMHQFIATFDGYHPDLQEYHVKEVLRTQPAVTQAFLLQTSILRTLCGPLCDAVTKGSGSEQLLQQIYQESQLLHLLDEGQGWYQYHDMFSQSLQHQLQLQFPEKVHDLHWRAAEWYQSHELYSEAIHHFVLVGAWSNVARLIDQVIIEELRRGSDHEVLRWLQQLPEEIFLRHPTLLFTYARLGAMSLPRGIVESFLQRIAARIEAKQAEARSPNEQALLSDLAYWEAAAKGNRTYPKIESPQNEIEELWQMLDLRDRGNRLVREGKLETGERVLVEAIDVAKKKSMLFVVVMVGIRRISLIARQGRLRHAEAVAREILGWVQVRNGGTLPASASVLLLPLIRIHYARNQLDEARKLIDETAMIDPQPTSVNIHFSAHGLLALILLAQGDTDAARDSLQAALELEPFASRLLSIEDLKVRQAVVYLREGDLLTAEQMLRQVTTSMWQPFQAPGEAYVTAWALLFLAQGRYPEAREALSRLDQASPDRLLFTFPMRKVLLAVTHWAQHKFNQAQREMIWAVRAAAAEEIIRPFLDCGPQIIPLLSFLMAGSKLMDRQRAFVKSLLDQLLADCPDFPIPSADELADRIEAARISPREQKVLQLLEEGLNNKELAARMIVTDSTVRTHLRNIYRKLEVSSRTQAIKRARELQLL